eukprot:Hpha_TRINITY_DN16609_c5_g1::TRINITY_DN16609_c5_g1_i1::g.178667::m.178667
MTTTRVGFTPTWTTTRRHCLLVYLAFFQVGMCGAPPPTVSPSFSPTQSPKPFCTVKRLHASGSHTCVTDFDGFLRCWGQNDVCQLGIGDSDNHGGTPGSMGGNLSFVNVVASNGVAGVA